MATEADKDAGYKEHGEHSFLSFWTSIFPAISTGIWRDIRNRVVNVNQCLFEAAISSTQFNIQPPGIVISISRSLCNHWSFRITHSASLSVARPLILE